MEQVECRYSESDGYYYLAIYDHRVIGRFAVVDQEGPIDKRPEWLTNIVNIAAVGDHFLSVTDPPPTRVLWFWMDKNYNLLEIGSHNL